MKYIFKMERDTSRILFNKYLKLKSKNSRITLLDGRVVTGSIVGFYRGNRYQNDPSVVMWHVVDEKDEMTLGFDIFGNRVGKLISQGEIAEIYFYENKSCFKFSELELPNRPEKLS